MQEIIVVEVAGERIGVPISRVRHVLGPQPVYPVPLADRYVAGVLNLRGRIVTAIDLARRLGVRREQPADSNSSLVVEWNDESYALLVDRIHDIVQVSEPVVNRDELTAMLPAWRELVKELYRTQDGILVEFDIERLLQPGRGQQRDAR